MCIRDSAMPYPDTYAALQQGVIDGLEGSILSFYGTKQYENVKEYSLTRHLLGVSAVCISKKCWDSLTDEQRTCLLYTSFQIILDYEHHYQYYLYIHLLEF